MLRIAGKKTVAEMTGLEIITLLSMASVSGHAVAEDGPLRTIIVLCIFVALLITVQFLAVKFNIIEKLFMGKATPVIKEGKIIPENLKKLRMSVDQLEAKMREKGIESFSDVKTGTIEISGHLGYELMRHAKPVTIGELETILSQLNWTAPPPKPKQSGNLFQEVVEHEHRHPIRPELD
nr:YetF domain-containing protein [Paenibacillus sp. MSJ-34]